MFQLSETLNIFPLYKLVVVGFSETLKILKIHRLVLENLEISKEKNMHSMYNPNTYKPSCYLWNIYMLVVYLCVQTHIYVKIYKNTLFKSFS